MFIAGRTPITKTNDYDILSVIWILSCNDETPLITYEGLHFQRVVIAAGSSTAVRTGTAQAPQSIAPPPPPHQTESPFKRPSGPPSGD